MKIIICEEQQILLDGLVSLLSKIEDFEIVAAINDCDDILSSLHATGADLLLTDIITKDKKNALDILESIKNEDVRIVVMTGYSDISFLKKAQKVGVHSYVYKNITTPELISVLRNTYAGYSVFPSEDKSKTALLSSLNDTELTILRLYCSGKEREEIASELFMSTSSLKAHISSILQKTGFSSIARVAIYAVSSGLIFA